MRLRRKVYSSIDSKTKSNEIVVHHCHCVLLMIICIIITEYRWSGWNCFGVFASIPRAVCVCVLQLVPFNRICHLHKARLDILAHILQSVWCRVIRLRLKSENYRLQTMIKMPRNLMRSNLAERTAWWSAIWKGSQHVGVPLADINLLLFFPVISIDRAIISSRSFSSWTFFCGKTWNHFKVKWHSKNSIFRGFLPNSNRSIELTHFGWNFRHGSDI